MGNKLCVKNGEVICAQTHWTMMVKIRKGEPRFKLCYFLHHDEVIFIDWLKDENQNIDLEKRTSIDNWFNHFSLEANLKPKFGFSYVKAVDIFMLFQ